jgi:multidrug efflux pump subunit AcrA (membrane-fusion protein)
VPSVYYGEMKCSNRLPVSHSLLAAALTCILANSGIAQTSYQTRSGEMLLFESSAASQVLEKIRSKAPGVIVALHVQPGDVVAKGQILGHLELDAAKLQLDLAQTTLDNKSNVEAALGQAKAWAIAREETAELVRRRQAEKSRLAWATAMEKVHQANYEGQLEAEKVQAIQLAYAKQQYDDRFLRATVAGTVSEVLLDVGKNVNFATHVLTISNPGSFTVPVNVPAPVAEALSPDKKVPIRSSDDNTVKSAEVESVIDNPNSTGEKIIRLLIEAADFPAATRSRLKGMKFDVLLPQVAGR